MAAVHLTEQTSGPIEIRWGLLFHLGPGFWTLWRGGHLSLLGSLGGRWLRAIIGTEI